MSRLPALAWISCSALLCGCASFSDLPPRPTYSLPSGATPLSIHLTTKQKAFLQVGREWIDLPTTGLVDVASDAVRDSGWVRAAPSSDVAPTLEIELIEYQSEGPGLLVLLTGFVLPGAVDHHLELKLTLSASPGAESTCSRSADMRTWYQTFLIFVYPFRSSGYRRIKATEALALQCLADLLERRDARPVAALANFTSRVRIE